MTLNSYFGLTSDFEPLCLYLVAFRDNCMETSKDMWIPSVVKMLTRYSSFW